MTMKNLDKSYKLILEMDKLKLVHRTTITSHERKESTAEHSWSASMIVMILKEHLKEEFPTFDEFKTIKLTLIHDTVEIYAGDVIAFDIQARKDKEEVEAAALQKLMKLAPDFGTELHHLWHEFEARETIEAQIAKAADSICPIFQRLMSRQSYQPINVNTQKLQEVKLPYFEFSKTFTTLFDLLKKDLLTHELILAS